MLWACFRFYLSLGILRLRLFRGADTARRSGCLAGLRLGWHRFILWFWPGCFGFLGLIRLLRLLRLRCLIFCFRCLLVFRFFGLGGALEVLVWALEPLGFGPFFLMRY